MRGFHLRWMPSTTALRGWVQRVRAIKPKMICPQHGSIFEGENVGKLLDWLESLKSVSGKGRLRRAGPAAAITPAPRRANRFRPPSAQTRDLDNRQSGCYHPPMVRAEQSPITEPAAKAVHLVRPGS